MTDNHVDNYLQQLGPSQMRGQHHLRSTQGFGNGLLGQQGLAPGRTAYPYPRSLDDSDLVDEDL